MKQTSRFVLFGRKKPTETRVYGGKKDEAAFIRAKDADLDNKLKVLETLFITNRVILATRTNYFK